MAMNVTPFVGTDNFNMATFNNMISQINSGVDNEISDVLAQSDTKAKIQIGSYVGTGTFGADNPNTLTFDFAPKAVIVQRANQTTNNSYGRVIAIPGMTQVNNGGSANNDDYVATVSFSSNSFSMYSISASGQMNNSGVTYVYIGIG